MRVSFTMDFRNPRHESWRGHWEDRLWLMTEAAAMGFDQLLVQEHFFTDDGYGPSMPVFQSLLIERRRDVRLGSHAYILPLHHAAQLARETAVLDHLSDGRLDVCLGAGHNPMAYVAWGRSPRTRSSRMEEGLDVPRLAWSGEKFSDHGRYYDLDGAIVTPSPMQKPFPPLWVAATAPPAAERAGRHGAHLHEDALDPGAGSSSKPYRQFDLIGTPDCLLSVLEPFKDSLPLTDVVLPNPAGGIPVRTEAVGA